MPPADDAPPVLPTVARLEAGARSRRRRAFGTMLLTSVPGAPDRYLRRGGLFIHAYERSYAWGSPA
jgi:hypothetical protein